MNVIVASHQEIPKLHRHGRSCFLNTSRLGFTLIELLAVLAVLSVLMALLFPVLGRMQGNAAQVKCVSNMKTLSGSLLSLFNENNLSLTTFAGGAGISTEIWPRQLKDKIGLTPTPELYYSPHTIKKISEDQKQEALVVWRTSYGLNLWDPVVVDRSSIEGGGRTTDMATIRLLKIKELSRYPLLVTQLNPSIPMTGRFEFRFSKPSGNGGVHLIHNGRANVAFADGHVAALDPEELGSLGFTNGYDFEGNGVTFP